MNQPNYKLRPEGFVARTINGHRALSWAGEFEKNGKRYVEFLTTVYSEKILANFWLRAAPADADALHLALETMVASLRLPE